MNTNSYQFYQLKDDFELIEEVKSGDLISQITLYKRYGNFINSIVKKFYFIESDYDDLFQMASIAFFKAIMNYSIGFKTSFMSYSRRCMENYLIDYIRKIKSRKNSVNCHNESLYKPLNNDDEIYLIDTIKVDIRLNPEHIFLEKESESLLTYRIDSLHLSKLERNILNQRCMHKTQKEIACALNIDIKSIDNALQRIKKKYNKIYSK